MSLLRPFSFDKQDPTVQSLLEGAVAGAAYSAYSGFSLMPALYVGGATAAGSMLGGNAASDADRYKRTAMIGAAAAGGAYLAGKRSTMELGVAAAAGVIGHAAVQTALFYPISTIGPILL